MRSQQAEHVKILLLRFSSFGDVTQCLSVPSLLKKHFKSCEIHWATRTDFKELIEKHPHVHKIWTLNKGSGFTDLIKLIWALKAEGFTHVYDAHNTTRSMFIRLFFRLNPFIKIASKSSYRIKRFFLFKLRINLFEQPFSGQRDLIRPLKKWGIPFELPTPPQLYLPNIQLHIPEKFMNAIALVPSSAHELKKWPKEYWMQLIEKFPNQNFILLGGPEDLFIEDIHQKYPEQTLNLAGSLSLLQSSYIISKSKLVVSNDTGLMHVAEQLGIQVIALMGPAPFGYPSRPSTKILELELYCKPCSKHGQGPCVNKEFHKCMRGISPIWVAENIKSLLAI